MRWLIAIALTVSLAFNVYFIIGEMQYYRMMEFSKIMNRAMGGTVENVSWGKGLQIFNDSIEKKFPEQANKKYYYINIWATFCGPCIKEMPWLDSLVGNMKRKDVAYIFMSGHSAKTTDDLLKRKKFRIKNFIYMDDMNDFISSVYTEQKKRSIVYPTVLVIDAKGKIYHSSKGAFENLQEAQEFVEMIEKLE